MIAPIAGGATLEMTTTVSLLSLGLIWFMTSRSNQREEASGKCILITGCDSGFGELLTQSASKAGFTIVAACYTDAGARRCDAKENVTGVVADLTTRKGRMKVVAVTKEVCEPFGGGLYAIVNNAGCFQTGLVEMLNPQVYEKHMSLMFHAPVELNYELLPLIKKAKGRLIFTTSGAGFFTAPFTAAYSAAKHAVEAYCDALRVEMRPWDVKVVVVEPAAMKTPIVESFAPLFTKTYTDAPRHRQQEYGQEWLDKITALMEFSSERAEDPNIVARDLMDALLLRRPPTRILSGLVAKFVVKPLSLLPDSIRDVAVFYMMGLGRATPKGLQ